MRSMVRKKKQDLSPHENARSKTNKKTVEVENLTTISTNKKENKRKIPAIDNHSDYEDSVDMKKKGKKKETDNTTVDCIPEVGITSEPKSIVTRMSPRSLKRVLETLKPVQQKSIQDMGFGDFLNGNFDFYYTPSRLGMWVVKNFDPNSCTIRMEDGRKIKITRELIHDILGIPMGDIKVKSLKEKNLADDVTAKWRDNVKEIVYKTKINITKLEQHLVDLSHWEFNLGFLVLFFSIFGLGNKDGTVNERIIPFLPNTDDVSQMDWCSYALESMVRGCKEYTGKCFSGPLLLMAIIYVNLTVSETVKVEKTVPAFKAWNSNILLKREQEEIELGGFGRLPIVEGLQVIETKKKKTYKKNNLIENRSITEDEDATEDIVDKNEDFKSLNFEEMKDILRQNLVKGNKLMVDTDYKLKIALSFNPEDKELKKMIEERNNLFLDFYKEEDNFDLSRNLIVSYDPKTAALAQPLNSQSKSSAIERANELQASLPSELPSFVKLMLPSHVAGCFWLDDVTVVLVDKDDQKFNTKYLDRKTELSGGWKAFSVAHKLLPGDVLVFQLIEQWKMKVYIVRESGLNEIDGALGLLNLVHCDMNSYQHQNNKDASNLQTAENMDIDLHQDNGLIMYNQSVDDAEDADSPVSEGLRFSQSVIEFKDIKGVDDFSIIVDNLVIDSEIPKHFQIKYYDLCRSQNMYLHENLLKGLNVKLAVGIILETVTIANAIRACKVTITRDDIATWGKTLKAFEAVGMKVGFLRARISKLMGLSFESNELLEANKIEQTKAEEEMRVIKEKLCGVQEMIKNLDVERETLKLKGQKLEQVFHKEANAPW